MKRDYHILVHLYIVDHIRIVQVFICFLKNHLGKHYTEPAGVPDIPGFRMVNMYMSCTDEFIKDQIERLFVMESPLRVVVATTAFGLGIDCPDVHHVINFGLPSDIESDEQEETPNHLWLLWLKKRIMQDLWKTNG